MIESETTPQFIIFGRFKDLANHLRNCGACVQNDWNLLVQDGYATEAELKPFARPKIHTELRLPG
jgi:hypothetical protein